MIRILAGLTGLATLAFGVGAFQGSLPFYLPISALLVTATLIATPRVPLVMRFIIGLFALGFIGLALVIGGNVTSLTPALLLTILPRPQAAVTASVFTALLICVNLLICFIPVVRRIIDMVNPFFESTERNEVPLGIFGTWNLTGRSLGLGLLGIIIILNVIQVYMTVLFSYWNNRFYTALQDKNGNVFWAELSFFAVLAALWITRGTFESYLTSILKLHWRRWMSQRYLRQWLSDKVHYRLALDGTSTDNPDQRISEDVRDFTDQSFDFYIQIFATSMSLYAFIQILWGISAEFPYKVGSFDLSNIPGYLVWMVLILAALITFGTHLVGRPLIALAFRKQKVEADFRYNLVRVRENDEQIALLHGEEVEQRGLMLRFRSIFDTTLAIIYRQLKITCVTLAYAQASVVLPFILLGPAYFATESMKLGDMTQTAQAFGNVQDAFSFFITSYVALAGFKAIVDRLIGFDKAIDHADQARHDGVQTVEAPEQKAIAGEAIDIKLPGGATLLSKVSFALRKGERTLVTGESGSGKTTLFRAIAGIWPYGKGKIALPKDEDVMLLPQQPYFPLGTLRAALAYPLAETAYDDAKFVDVLDRIGLPQLSDKLDAHDNWSNALSGGEKQRIAMARAILRQPAWLFLDEATSALDEQSEAKLYSLLREVLPATTIVSIGHRSSLTAFHDRRLAVVKEQGGARLEEQPLAAFGT